jgi:hypothetical protein
MVGLLINSNTIVRVCILYHLNVIDDFGCSMMAKNGFLLLTGSAALYGQIHRRRSKIQLRFLKVFANVTPPNFLKAIQVLRLVQWPIKSISKITKSRYFRFAVEIVFLSLTDSNFWLELLLSDDLRCFEL